MKKILAVFLALVAPIASAQVVINPGGGRAASGSAVSGCATAGAVLYMDASTLLACGAAPAPNYDATNIRLTVGTGSTTQAGFIFGYSGISGKGSIWSSAVTPTSGNYAIRLDAATTVINSPNVNVGVSLRVADSAIAVVGGASGRGAAIAAGTATADEQALSTTQTWNAAGVTFTGHKYTVTDTASAAGSLHSQWLGGAAGATTLMSLSKAGQLVVAPGSTAAPTISASDAANSGIWFNSGYAQFNNAPSSWVMGLGANPSNGLVINSLGYMGFTSGTVFGAGDTFFMRDAAAVMQMGADVNGAAVAQTLKAHDGITGTDIAGANLTIAGGKGTGAGAGGNRIDQTAPSLGTGTTAQTLQDRTLLVAKAKALTAAAATNVVLINVASGAYGGGEMEYTVQASDGTDHQARSGRIQWAVVNKAGTETCTVSGASEAADSSTVAASSGTLTYAITADTTAANGCYIAFNAVSSLVETTLNIAYRITANGGTSTFTAQ